MTVHTAHPHLLYVEDDPTIADMTIEVLSESYRVTHFSDGAEALRAALRERFDVMVIDRRLPGLDGVSLVSKIRTANITTPILLLTALSSVADKVDGLDAGANDYLAKPFDFDELLARLRALRRTYPFAAARRSVADWTFAPEANTLYGPTGRRVTLTDTESKLLSLLTESPDHVFSREEIVSAVFASGDSVSVVDTYVHYIRRKTDPGIIETVRGRGYRAGDAEE